MTQAVNLANFSNYLDSGGGMSPNALNAATPVSKGGTGATSLTNAAILRGNGSSAISAASASDIVTVIGTTNVQNATNLKTTNFTVSEVAGVLTIKYGATTILQIASDGSITNSGTITTGTISSSGSITATGAITSGT